LHGLPQHPVYIHIKEFELKAIEKKKKTKKKKKKKKKKLKI
jgi:hypothetical protein